MDKAHCQHCSSIKSSLCPICTTVDYDLYGGVVQCIWCDGLRVVCPNGPHFTGIINMPIQRVSG